MTRLLLENFSWKNSVGETVMRRKLGKKDEFYGKLVGLVFPIAFQQFMLSLVSASDAVMLGKLNQDSLSAVSLAGQGMFLICFLRLLPSGQACLRHSTGEKAIRIR